MVAAAVACCGADRTQVVVFDKTGTLTVGKPEVQQVMFIEDGMPVPLPNNANNTNSSSSGQHKSESSGSGSSGKPACCETDSQSKGHAQSKQAAATKPCCAGKAAAASGSNGRTGSPFAVEAIQHPKQQQEQQQQKKKRQPWVQPQKPPSARSAGQGGSCCAAVAGQAASTASAGAPPASGVKLLEAQRRVLAVLAAVEARSEHPLAKAVVSYAEQQGIKADELHCSIDSFHMQAGRGVRCSLIPANDMNGITTASSNSSNGSSSSTAGAAVDVVIGNIPWLQDCGVGLSAAARQKRAEMEGEGATVVAAALNGRAVALLSIADSMKPEAPAVLRLLQQRGMQCWMITGDSR